MRPGRHSRRRGPPRNRVVTALQHGHCRRHPRPQHVLAVDSPNRTRMRRSSRQGDSRQRAARSACARGWSNWPLCGSPDRRSRAVPKRHDPPPGLAICPSTRRSARRSAHRLLPGQAPPFSATRMEMEFEPGHESPPRDGLDILAADRAGQRRGKQVGRGPPMTSFLCRLPSLSTRVRLTAT